MSKSILNLINLVVVPVVLYFYNFHFFQIWIWFEGVIILGIGALWVYAGFNREKFNEVWDRYSSRLFWIGLPFATLFYLIFLWFYQNISLH